MKYLWRVSAIIAAGGLHILLQAGVLLSRSDFAWNSFRSYFAGDQLSYMSMVVNTYNGQLANFEPFTETGVNNYPHLYYVLLGLGARVLGIDPLQAWSTGGLFVQFLLVCFLATVLVIVGGRAWLALLAPLPFILGTFSFLLVANAWFTGLASHAVLWGAFATMFTLNGEVFSLCLGGAALLLLVLAWSWAKRPWMRIVLASVASLMIGATANVQTYSFLIVVFVAVYVVGAYGIATARRRWWLALASLVLVGLLFVVGPLIAHDAGPLATLILGLTPAFPGLIVVAIRSRGLLVFFIGLAVLASAPQLLGTALGIVNHDPFLTYRVASSKQLGVGFSGVLGSLALLLPLLGILAAGIWRRSALWIAYPVGVLAAWTIVSSNDVWGANQEPYRFWLDTFVIVCMTILPVAVIVVRSLLAGPSAEVVEAPDKGATAGVVSESTAAGGRPRRRRVVVLSVLVLCVVVGAVSTGDYVNFLRDPRYQGLWNYNNPRDKAIAAVAAENRPARGDMFVSDPCIDALEFKLVSGQPEAFYNAGMAWPKNEPAVQQVMMDRGNGLLIAAHAQSAGVTRVITDSACTTANWPMQYGSELTLLGTRHYDLNGVRQSISVWKIG